MDLLPVAPEHIPALSTLAAATFSTTFGHLYPPEDLADFLETSYNHDTLLAETRNPAYFWRMAWEDGKALGYLQCAPVGLPHPEADPTRHGELKRLYVSPAAQGKGLGRRLMNAALRHLEDRYGDAPQWIGVWSENHRAQALYGSCGFVKVGAYEFPVGRMRDHEFILRRIPAPRT
jgi:ribosomal protein S18 acetylase RimI-like enzyme